MSSLARFEREARAIAALNKSNVCTVYDIGPKYLVVELVEGETLAARLKSGSLPLKTVLLYGSQILMTLSEAHGALGEHVPNRVMFQNFIQPKAVHFVQADCTRLAGISEFLTVSLLARKHGLPVLPHVGDMGQIHQHLVLFDQIALVHDSHFLEHIPHLRNYFVQPACIEEGVYRTPQQPGISCDLKDRD